MSDNDIMPLEYFEAEFRKYFRDASAIRASFSDDCETLSVRVTFPLPALNASRLVSWLCEIGSDDDWYVFSTIPLDNRDKPLTITLPLMADALEL